MVYYYKMSGPYKRYIITKCLGNEIRIDPLSPSLPHLLAKLNNAASDVTAVRLYVRGDALLAKRDTFLQTDPPASSDRQAHTHTHL